MLGTDCLSIEPLLDDILVNYLVVCDFSSILSNCSFIIVSYFLSADSYFGILKSSSSTIESYFARSSSDLSSDNFLSIDFISPLSSATPITGYPTSELSITF